MEDSRPAFRGSAGGSSRRAYPGSVMTYLDHAATTPMLPEVLAAMTEQLGRVGNASSLHASGRAARRAAEQSRERLAEALGARPSEVLFTGGGTESDNLAVKGLFWARRQADSRRRRIVVSPAEHHAVLDSVEWLAKHDGADVTWLAVEPTGRVTPAALAEALGDGDDVAVASVMWANNEIGTVSDIAALAAVAARGRRPAAHRRRPGRRAGAGRLRRQRRGRADDDRAQARRPDGRRCAAAAPGRRVHAPAARWGSGAGRPFRHPRRRRDRRAGRGHRRRRRLPGGARRPPGRPARTGWSPESSSRCPTSS